MVDPAKQRATYKSGSGVGLSFLAASLVLFPSIFAIIKPPYGLGVALWIYVVALIVSAALLAYAYYLSAFTEAPPPVKTGGLGMFCALLAAAAFALFIFGNMLEDARAAPVVTALVVDGADAKPGGMVIFSAEGVDESGDLLDWHWRLRPPLRNGVPPWELILPSTLRTGVWRVPEAAPRGRYVLSVSASDGSRESRVHRVDLRVGEQSHGQREF